MEAKPGQAPEGVTVDEWRELLTKSEIKYEYHDGRLVAAESGTLDHAQICFNAQSAILQSLGDRRCRTYGSDAPVRLTPTHYCFADVVVTCDDLDRGSAREVLAPRVVIEVLSNETEQQDRGGKFALARACPSVVEYVLIATRYQTVEVFRRAESLWTYEGFGPGEIATLSSIEVSFPVAAVYQHTDVPATVHEVRSSF